MTKFGWLGGATVRASDLRSSGRGSWVRFPVGSQSSYLGQLSFPSLRGRYMEYRPLWLGLRRGVFTCAGWQVTLCDPIWQVTLRSYEMGSDEQLYSALTLKVLLAVLSADQAGGSVNVGSAVVQHVCWHRVRLTPLSSHVTGYRPPRPTEHIHKLSFVFTRLSFQGHIEMSSRISGISSDLRWLMC